jgi:hypothetical protein
VAPRLGRSATAGSPNKPRNSRWETQRAECSTREPGVEPRCLARRSSRRSAPRRRRWPQRGVRSPRRTRWRPTQPLLRAHLVSIRMNRPSGLVGRLCLTAGDGAGCRRPSLAAGEPAMERRRLP